MSEILPSAYPLQWPPARARKTARRPARFSNGGSRLTVAVAVARLTDELARLDARYCVVSSNLQLRQDGLPRSGQPEPSDSGVAVYFQLAGRPICMPCDSYTRVADNIAGIAAHIEATRAIERYGVATVEEMFAGFAALPPPGQERPWRVVLGINDRASLDVVEQRYRSLARQRHPDFGGGSDAQMAELNRAIAEARRELSG